ncbi:MAG: hypothetical protein O7B23_10800 [Deltaproteobacteria bacterium]|nr:hypothetical protein [Deltaproteobacteria bacterium]
MTVMPNVTGEKRAQIRPWWKVEKRKAAQELFSTVGVLQRNQQGQIEEQMHYMRLYGNWDVSGRGYVRTSLLRNVRESRMRFNLVSSLVDTALSLFVGTRPKAAYITDKGDFELQQQAELRSQAIAGQLDDLGVHALAEAAALDGLVGGNGYLYGYLDDKTRLPIIERVLPLELLVDHQEAINGAPRNIYRMHTVAREVLMDAYPSKAAILKDAGGPEQGINDIWRREIYGTETISDMVLVVEAWHCKSSVDAKDGRHAIVVSTGSLNDEDYPHLDLPFATFKWKPRQMGWQGIGIAEEAREAQRRINLLITKIERTSDLGSTAYMVVDRGSKVNTRQLTNEPVSIIEYDGPGQPPLLTVNNAIPTELFEQVERVREEMMSQLGLSQLAVEGKKPPGLTSGAAQRAFDDLSSRRHVQNVMRWDGFYMEIVRLLERLNDQAVEEGANPNLSARERSMAGPAQIVARVDWKALQMKENRYVLRMYPTSSLPSTPAGRFATVTEWIGAGLIDQQEALSLLGMPDLDVVAKLRLADRSKTLNDVSKLLNGKLASPEPFQNLPESLETARRALLVAEVDGAKQSKLERVRQYIEQMEAMVEAARAAEEQRALGLQQQQAQVQAQAQAQAQIQVQAAAQGAQAPPGAQAPLTQAPGS